MEEEIVLMEENDIEEINIEEENYSGKPYELPIASKDVLGGIKVGENLTIDADGTLNAQAGGSGGFEIIALKSNETLNISTNSVYEYFKMAIISQMGNNFLLEDGNLKIGKGVSKVLLSFTASLSWIATSGNKYVRVERDGQALAMSKKYVVANSTVADIICMTPVMIDVQEGDILKLGAYGTKDDNYVKGQVYLTVQKIS